MDTIMEQSQSDMESMIDASRSCFEASKSGFGRLRKRPSAINIDKKKSIDKDAISIISAKGRFKSKISAEGSDKARFSSQFNSTSQSGSANPKAVKISKLRNKLFSIELMDPESPIIALSEDQKSIISAKPIETNKELQVFEHNLGSKEHAKDLLEVKREKTFLVQQIEWQER
jgi:hypothetical protein